MAHTYASLLYQCVFSTKGRRSSIPLDLPKRLWPYIGGVARENKTKALAVGGTDDHAHVLLSLPTTVTVAKAIQLIKGGTSKWIPTAFPGHTHFEWQEGYGAFSIGISQVKDTIAYIDRQEEHHRRKSFQEEYIEFLQRHGIEYDARYVWD
jgi:putative transposase